MKNNILIITILVLLCKTLSAQVQPTWESINERGYPQWFSDAKLGIFIHWGVYSVPAYASLEGPRRLRRMVLSRPDDQRRPQGFPRANLWQRLSV